MLLASWPLQDFAGFLQIISWITLPVLLVAVLSTVFLHYYQRRKKTAVNNEEEAFALANASPADRYDQLKQDFESLQVIYHANESELNILQAEMKRQDWVIDELRSNLAVLEKNIDTLKLALQLKEEQITDMRHFVEEKQVPFQPRPASIAAEIS